MGISLAALSFSYMDFYSTQAFQGHLDQGERLICIGQPKQGVVFSLFGVPFVLVGLMFVFGRFIWDARQRAATHYALPEISYSENKDGWGNIVLGFSDSVRVLGRNIPIGKGNSAPPAFEMIPQVRSVYNKIHDLQRQSGGGA